MRQAADTWTQLEENNVGIYLFLFFVLGKQLYMFIGSNKSGWFVNKDVTLHWL